jgi:hypothetical protein
MCDDIEQTIADLGAKGAQFSGGVSDYGFGLATNLQVPGADDILLYQPQHAQAYDI